MKSISRQKVANLVAFTAIVLATVINTASAASLYENAKAGGKVRL
jgi:hypothetical protein